LNITKFMRQLKKHSLLNHLFNKDNIIYLIKSIIMDNPEFDNEEAH